MNKKSLSFKMLTFFSYVLLISSLFTYPKQVFSQNVTLSISPPLLETVIKPGKSILIAYTLENRGDPMIVSTDIRPFKPTGLLGNIAMESEFTGPIRFNLENSNIKLGDSFFLQAREGQQLLLKIRVPEGTPEGDYYYTFYAGNTLGKRQEGVSASQAQALIGSNILITVTETGAVDINGSIGTFSVIPTYNLNIMGKKLAFFDSSDIVPIKLILQNTGKNIIKPHGTITLQGDFGERAQYDLLPQNILKESSRMILATPSAALLKSEKLPTASLYVSGFFMGKYTIETIVDYGIGTPSSTQSIQFYAFPIKIGMIILAILFGIFLIKRLLHTKKPKESS